MRPEEPVGFAVVRQKIRKATIKPLFAVDTIFKIKNSTILLEFFILRVCEKKKSPKFLNFW